MIRFSHITTNSYVDGPGCRAVLFLQGCTVGCQGCQNKALWPAQGGHAMPEYYLAEMLMGYDNRNITISGGEPTDQMDRLIVLVKILRAMGARHVIVYTGRTFEWLVENRLSGIMELMKEVDVLVDGPFVAELDDPMITWRGSRNQRPIDCKATVQSGELITLDWSNPEIQIDADGNMHMPVGLAPDFAEAGEVQRSRMCGQTKPIKSAL